MKSLVILLLTSFLFTSFSAEASSEDAPLRSAFTLQFTRYIEWPNLGEQFLIDVIDDQQLYDSLKESTKDKKVGTANISVRMNNHEGFEPSRYSKSQIIILAKGNTKETKTILNELKKLNALIISYGDDLASMGSIINFLMLDNHLRFEINQKAAESKKLKISSQLLKLGKPL